MQYAGAKASKTHQLFYLLFYLFLRNFFQLRLSIQIVSKRKLEPLLRTGRQCHKLNTVVRTGSGQMLSHQTRLLFY